MKTDTTLDRLIKDGASERDIVLYLADNVTITELARQYYELYKELSDREEFTPIRISKADFDKHFRIIGFKSDGTPEARGKPIGTKNGEGRTLKEARAFSLATSYRKADQIKGYDTKDNVSGDWIMENIFASSCVYCGDSDWEHLGCDRIDNTKPHTPDNCICACRMCNVARKDNYTVAEFKEYRKLRPYS